MTADQQPPQHQHQQQQQQEMATKAVVHPLVLLSAVDHYNRVASNTSRRVVGVLLGKRIGDSVHLSNSFALPFEEDEAAGVWFLDHNYLENMVDMFKKINASERIVGWYHTGPKLRPTDLEINRLMAKYAVGQAPVLVVIDIHQRTNLPTDAYLAHEEIHDDGTKTTYTFNHIACAIEAEEAEEIGVEHLLRDVVAYDSSAHGSLGTRVALTHQSLMALSANLVEITDYLDRMLSGALPVCHPILYNLQTMLNLLQDVDGDRKVTDAFISTTNDRWAVMYLAALVRSVVALHDLVDNKLHNAERENAAALSDSKAKKEDVAKKDETALEPEKKDKDAMDVEK